MQVRPGIAVSAGLHIVLFFYLAYALAFHPTEKPKDEEHAIDMVAAPPPPPPPPPAAAPAAAAAEGSAAAVHSRPGAAYRRDQYLGAGSADPGPAGFEA